MYKYIVYCSVSAIIIIVSKYIYQNWLKITHYISDLKNQISLLQNKVKTLEGELEKRTISGGAKIPIVFRPIEKKSPKKTITILDNTSESSSTTLSKPVETIEGNEIKLKSPNHSIDSKQSKQSNGSKELSIQQIKQSPHSFDLSEQEQEQDSVASRKELDTPKEPQETNQNDSFDFRELDKNSEEFHLQNELNNLDSKDLNFDLDESNTNTNTDIKITKKSKKKSVLPDAKLYNNGDKYKEGEIEYICVVGKRGGHSWKKIY
jgi:hypothetical protein